MCPKPDGPGEMTQIPGRIARVGELAQELRWTWNRHAGELFRRLGYQLWCQTAQNLVRMFRLLLD